MAWVLHTTDAKSVYWRRTEDGTIIGFNKEGIGTPFSDESAPPPEIEKWVAPLEDKNAQSEIDMIRVRLALLEESVALLQGGGK